MNKMITFINPEEILKSDTEIRCLYKILYLLNKNSRHD